MGGDGTSGEAHPEVIGRARMAVPLPLFRCRAGAPPGIPDQGAWTTRPLPRIPGGAPSMRRGAGAARTRAGRGSHSPDRPHPRPSTSGPSTAGISAASSAAARPGCPPCGGHRRAGSPRGPHPSSYAGGEHCDRGIGTDVPVGRRVTGRQRTVRLAARPLRLCGPPRAAPLHDPSSVTMGRDGAGAHGFPSS